MKAQFLTFTSSSWNLIKRMAFRTIALALMTVIGFELLHWFEQLGTADRFSIVRQYPEFLILMKAACTFTFIEMSLFWIRIGTQPGNDVQEAITVANSEPMSAAIVHITNTVTWALRFAAFLYLMGPV